MFFRQKHESILIALVVAIALVGAARAVRAADAYDAMRLNWFNNLTGGTAYDATDPDVAAATTALTNTANGYWTILKATKPFSGGTPFNDIPLGTASDNLTDVYGRLHAMTLAYWAKGGALYQNAALLADIITTLDWLNANVYNASTTQYGNWFTWLIGTPLDLNDIVVLLYDSLSATQIKNYTDAINHFTPTPTTVATSGANCAWASIIVALRGVIVKDPTKLAAASAQFSTLTADVTAPDGFFADGSYLGHAYFSYNGGYGLYMLQELSAGYYLFNPGALNPLPATKRAVVYGWVTQSYQPLMYQGKIPYYSIGREISRGPSDGRGESISSIANQVALGDTSTTAGQVRAFAKNVFAASGRNYSGLGGIGTVIQMKALMSDATVTAAVDPIGTRIFTVMDKATTVQSAFSASVAWYSTRTRNYESINGENLEGWHQADGMLYLDDADWNQYNGTFWATVNSQRLAGTTVTAGSTPAQSLANGSTFAGGATTPGGQYGAVGFTLQPGNGQTLVANKAWIILDDEVVCLGSGISSTDGKKVETIVENRKLSPTGTNVLTVNGTAQPSATLPWTSTQGVSSMHLAGSVAGSDIGYYFPAATNLDFTRETRTSSWSMLDATKSTAQVSDSYLTVGDSHGISPSANSYAYVLLPNYTAAQVAAYAAAPVASVLENDANVSAVRDAKLGLSAAVFWLDQSYQATIDNGTTFVSADKKAVVLVQTGNGQLSVSVSDPTQANTAGINIALTAPVTGIVSADTGVSVSQLSPTLKLNVATSGAKGKTFNAVFTIAPATTASQIPIAAVFASADDGDVPSNTIDNNLNTRWSAQGDGQWIQYDFPAAYQVGSTSIAFYGGTSRTMPFDVQASMDGTTWTTVFSAVSSGKTNALQAFALPSESWGRHVRIVGHGNSQGTGWNSLTEVQFFGSTAVSSYSDYRALNFTAAQLTDPSTSGAAACPTGDGVSNLIKYSQGLAPTVNGPMALPTALVENNYLTLTYVRLKNATDLVYTPQISNDLAAWQSGGASITQVSATDLDATRQQVKVRSTTPVSNGGPGFMRLSVMQSAAGN